MPGGSVKARTVIAPGRTLAGVLFSELREHHELFYFLVWRDVKVRYKQTVLGALWAILQPLLTAAVFTLLFGRLAGISSEGLPYPLFAFVGLLAWGFFSQGVAQAASSLLSSSNLLTKVYFPRLVIPAAAILAGLVDLVVALPALAVLMLVSGARPPVAVAAFPLFVVLAVLATLGVGLWVSALNAQFRDVRYALPFVVQLWLFVSPVIYPTRMIAEKIEEIGLPAWAVGLNPLATVIEGFRWSILGGTAPSPSLVWASLGATAVLVVSGLYYFRAVERSFADVV
jgi:lipopolysaccharide transport system permease protein